MSIYDEIEGLLELDGLAQQEVAYEEDMLRGARQKLIDLNIEQKALTIQKKNILSSLADKEKISRLFELLKMAHKGILEDQGELDEILLESFDNNQETVDFFKKYKHDKFYRSKEVFDEFSSNPVQVAMVRTKSVSKRDIGKAETYHQHLNYMHSAKQIHDLKERVNRLEQRELINKFESSLNLGAVFRSISELEERVSTNEEVISGVIDELVKLSDRGIDTRKLLAHKLKLENPNLKNKELAKQFGVSVRTVCYWLKDMKDIN